MKTTIDYTICFFSPWHCGSGTSAGADVDELVVKDKNGMPYIPGKTLKGLIREAVDNYLLFSGEADKMSTLVDLLFGKIMSADAKPVSGCAYFGNATLPEAEYTTIVCNKAQRYMYEKITTTAIDCDGIAKDHSLRSMEVVVPCTLHACIADVPEEYVDVIVGSFGLLKRLGQKRNRGLGRCEFRNEEL